MREVYWNNVIWQAIKNLKSLKKQDKKNLDIERIFSTCETSFRKLRTPKRDTELRMFALAYYCDKTYNSNFFNSMLFPRFSGASDFFNFEYLAKTLIKEKNFALIVFWVILRLSGGNAELEKEMKSKVMELRLKAR
jgi:hypothetical protein